MAGRILYLTDKFKVSQGYEPAFGKMLAKCGIKRQEVLVTDIYNLVADPLIRKGNEKIWRFNPAKLTEITNAFAQRVKTTNPSLIVVSCPAILGVLTGGDTRLATLDKMRGGVYRYNGITVIVVYPITAIHQQVDDRILVNDDAEADTQEPYRVKLGARILAWDWQKVGRFHHGKQRVIPKFQYSVCRTLEDCYAAREYLLGCVLISSDIETANFPPQITCVGYTGLRPDGTCHSFVIPFSDLFREGGCFWDSVEDHALAWGVVCDINDSDIAKTFQNGAYDNAYFIRDSAPTRNWLWDSMILWWSLYMELPKKLDFISSILLDNFQYWKDDIKGDKIDLQGTSIKATSQEGYWRYNALDCYNTLFNTLYLLKLFEKHEYVRINYQDAFMRSLSGLAMSMRGVKADYERRSQHKTELELERDNAITDLRYMLADNTFNINSAPQKKSLLYDFMGLRPMNDRGRFINEDKPLKGTNAPSAGAIPLKLAKPQHPLFRHIIEQMEKAMTPDKQISNVCNMFLATDRFRTAFSAVGTETTRFSSKSSSFWDGGNAQNIRKEYRDWMVADPDCVFIDVDYSQSDDVFMAYESQDPDKIKLVESGLDGHAVNGELFFGIPYDKIVAGKKADDLFITHPTKGVRPISKRIVHGANFQMAAMTLYVTMGREAVVAAAELLGFKDAASWQQDKLVHLCGQFMLKYRHKYRRLTNKEYYAEIAKELAGGTMTNCFGITRQFLGDARDNGTQREATAFIGQSATAGNMNRVMYEIDYGWMPKRFRDGANPHYGDEPRKMNWESHGIALHLQIHDSFVAQLNTKHPLWRQAAHNLLYVMDRPIIIHGRTVRIKTEAEIGIRWGAGLIKWDGDMQSLDSVVDKARSISFEEIDKKRAAQKVA